MKAFFYRRDLYRVVSYDPPEFEYMRKLGWGHWAWHPVNKWLARKLRRMIWLWS